MLSVFEEKLNSASLGAQGSHIKFGESINVVAKTVFNDPEKACTTKKKHQQKARLKMFTDSPQNFAVRLELISKHLAHFPRTAMEH